MKRHVKLSGPGAKGTVVNATLLRELLTLLVDGSQRALRLRTQGRSTARGKLPHWIQAASDFSVEIREGSTVLEVTAPTLSEADPDEFRQRQLFPEVDPDLTGIDYLVDSLTAAIHDENRSEAYDRDLLRLFRGSSSVFEHKIDSLTFTSAAPHANTLSFAARHLEQFHRLEHSIPSPQRTRIAGKLDTIRHSDRTFILKLQTGEQLRGVIDRASKEELQQFWGQSVIVSGTAHFTSTGKVQRLEADRLSSASDNDTSFWSSLPTPSLQELSYSELRRDQGPRTGINALFGRWPGDETDEEVAERLESLS